jgi:hypothetical protein
MCQPSLKPERSHDGHCGENLQNLNMRKANAVVSDRKNPARQQGDAGQNGITPRPSNQRQIRCADSSHEQHKRQRANEINPVMLAKS